MITLTNISKSYGNKKVLNNINMVFKPGEIYGIAGENGAGKTTLFKCIAGLETFEGDVKYDKGILKNAMGFCTQIHFSFPKLQDRNTYSYYAMPEKYRK